MSGTVTLINPPQDPDARRMIEATMQRAFDSMSGTSASAYATGRDVVFGDGAGSQDGRRLMAHELTHVVQQRGGAGR